MRWLFSGFLALMGCAASVPPIAAQSSSDGLGALVRELVVSLQGDGGVRVDMILVAADSASAAFLRLADLSAMPAPGPKPLLCPGSTEADGQHAAPPVGYAVQVTLTTTPDTATRELRITNSCSFRYRGSVRPFAEGGAWELRRDAGRWTVTASLYYWIT